MRMNTILKNHALNKSLVEKGYVVIDYFEEWELEKVKQSLLGEIQDLSQKIMLNNNKNIEVDYHCTFLDNDVSYKKLVQTHLSKLLQAFISELFVDYKLIQTNIFNKPPNAGYVCPHQNLTTVNEEEFTSVSIWIPLQETTIENGTVYLLAGSHNKFEKYRNADIEWAPLKYTVNFEDYNMAPINMKIGQALVFNDSLVHGSPINKSKNNRIVFHALGIPIESTPIYCNLKGDLVEIIEVDDEFWQKYTPGEGVPIGRIIKTAPFISKEYNTSNFMNVIKS